MGVTADWYWEGNVDAKRARSPHVGFFRAAGHRPSWRGTSQVGRRDCITLTNRAQQRSGLVVSGRERAD